MERLPSTDWKSQHCWDVNSPQIKDLTQFYSHPSSHSFFLETWHANGKLKWKCKGPRLAKIN